MLGGYPTTGKALPDTTHLQFLHIGWLIHHSSIPCAKAGFIQNVYTLHPKFATCNKKNQPPAVFSLSFSMVFCSFFFWLFWLSPRSIPRVYRSLVPSLQELIKEGVELSSLPTWVCQADGWPVDLWGGFEKGTVVGLEFLESFKKNTKNTLEWLLFQKCKRNCFF